MCLALIGGCHPTRKAHKRTAGRLEWRFRTIAGGGPGPNNFDMLAPLENWVERGVAPDRIMASHLRERKEGVPLLAAHFFTHYCRENNKYLDSSKSVLHFQPEACRC